MSPDFSNGDALGALLTIQGLLVAAVSLLVVVMESDQSRRLIIPLLTSMAVLRMLSAGGALVGVGCAAAWVAVFTGGSFVDWTRVIVAGAALAAIVIMTVVTSLLLFARRT